MNNYRLLNTVSNTVTKGKKLRGTENISIETGILRTLGLASRADS